MSAKRLWLIGVVVAILGGTGCCRWCERWCNHPVPAVQALPTTYAAPCTPCCPPPCCAPTVAGAPQQWQRNPGVPNGCCP